MKTKNLMSFFILSFIFALISLVSCKQAPELAFLQVIKVENQLKTDFYVNEEFNPDDIVVQGYYSDGTIKELTDYTTNFDEVVKSSGTNKKVTVTFENQTTFYLINVFDYECIGIKNNKAE